MTAKQVATRKASLQTAKPVIIPDNNAAAFWQDGELGTMKRAVKRRTEAQESYSRRDLRNMALVSVLGTALLYTTLWLIYKVVS